MRVGMLWFDDSKARTVSQKIERAAAHYEGKYGLRPTVCYVHTSWLITAIHGIVEVPGIEVKGTNMVLPHHLWLGRKEEDRT